MRHGIEIALLSLQLLSLLFCGVCWIVVEIALPITSQSPGKLRSSRLKYRIFMFLLMTLLSTLFFWRILCLFETIPV